MSVMKSTATVFRASEIPEVPITFAFRIPEIEDKWTRFDFTSGKFDCEGSILKKGAYILLTGKYSAKVTLTCDRCVETFDFNLDGVLDLTLQEATTEGHDEKMEFYSTDAETDYYENDIVNVNTYFVSQFLLDLPETFLCSPECPGLCGHCGKKLENGKECGCEKPILNNPFARLKNSL